MTPTRLDTVLARTFLLFVTTAVLFVVADRISINFLSGRSPIEREYPVESVRHPKPYVMFGGLPNVSGLNALGYRGRVPAVPKPAGEYRVILLGGSTVVVGDPPLSVLLERQLHIAGHTNVRVYNFGVISSVSGMELARIVFEVPDFTPDLILLYDGGNDMLHPWRFDPRPGYPFNFMVYENNPFLESNVRTYPALAAAAYGSNILRAYLPGFFVDRFVPQKRLRSEMEWGSPTWMDGVADRYADNIRKAEAFSRSIGSGFIAVFQPTIYSKKPLDPGEGKLVHPDGIRYAEHVRQRVLGRKDPGRPTVNITDLSALFDGHAERVYEDHIHVYPDGNVLVAQALSDIVIGQALH